jgi:hypothetical protein
MPFLFICCGSLLRFGEPDIAGVLHGAFGSYDRYPTRDKEISFLFRAL